MRNIKKALSFVLVLCMLFTSIPMTAFAEEGIGEGIIETNDSDLNDGQMRDISEESIKTRSITLDTSVFYRIFHLDNGRRYFSVNEIKGIIDQLSENDYTHLQLAVGNNGLRFLLDDMSIIVEGNTYSDEQVTSAIQAGNKSYDSSVRYSPGATEELTQSDMDSIVTYANKKGISIIPMINTPGHMTALVYAMRTLGICSTTGDNMSITDSVQVEFVKALLEKYIEYFSDAGCQFFDMGADEYSFSNLNSVEYGSFVSYINEISAMIKNANMVPIAFNDGIYYKSSDDDFVAVADKIDKEILIAYWCQASNYASAATLASKGFKLLNNNDAWYYVFGDALYDVWAKGQWGYADSKTALQNTPCTKLSGADSTGVTPVGSVLCFWCDYPGNDNYDEEIQAQVYDLIRTMATSNPDYFTTGDSENGGETGDGGEIGDGGETGDDGDNGTADTKEKIIELTIGEKKTEIVSGNVSGEYATEDTTVATVKTEYINQGGEAEKELGSKISIEDGDYTPYKGVIYGNGHYLVMDENGNISGTQDINTATVFNVQKNSNDEVTIFNGYKYLSASDTALTSSDNIDSNWMYYFDGYCNIFIHYDENFYSSWLGCNDGIWTLSTDYEYTNPGELYRVNGETTVAKDETKITFEGLSTGTTYVTIGDIKYTIIVSTKTETIDMIIGETISREDLTAAMKLENTNSEAVKTTVEGNILTFKALALGTATVTTENAVYIINVKEINFDDVSDLPIQLWITNSPISLKDVTYATSGSFLLGDSENSSSKNAAHYVKVSAESAYGINGVELAEVVPTTVINGNVEYVIWRGKILDSSTGIQTLWGDNKSNSGTTFSYVRYYKEEWSVSSDRVTWTSVTGEGSTENYITCEEQLIAYYMQRTNLTEHIITDVIDYGNILSDVTNTHGNIKQGAYVILDFAVKFPNNIQIPDSFSQKDKTLLYHCAGTGSDTGVANEYRRLNAIVASETSFYETYMITIKSTDENTVNKTFSAGVVPTNYSYNGTEYVIWAENEDAIPDGYTTVADLPESNKNHGTVTYGGTPAIDELYIYNLQGMLITYYIRGKETEDSLQVKYIDDNTSEVFYTTNIPITNVGDELKDFANSLLDKSGTLYQVPGDTTLADNQYYIIDTYESDVYIRSDLTKLINLQGVYSTGIYTHVKAEIDANDPKILILHYQLDTSKTTKNFVLDFGLPITVEVEQLLNKVDDVDSVSKDSDAKYGTISCNGTSFTYTPNEVMRDSEAIIINVNYKNGTTSKYTVGFMPATTVYYEEGFAELSGFEDGSKGTGLQETETAGSRKYNYGYDDSYAAEAAGPSNGTQASSLKAGDTANFIFTGTGVGVYTNNTPDTGHMVAKLYKINADGTTKLKKLIHVETAMVDGKTEATFGQAVNAYNVPDIVLTNLDYDNYKLTITNVAVSSESGAKEINLDGFRVYGTLKDQGNMYYRDDLEDNPSYVEMRDHALKAFSTNTDANVPVSGEKIYAQQIAGNLYSQIYASDAIDSAVIINSSTNYTQDALTDILDNGPKNEVYLMPGSTIVFKVKTNREVQIGLKALNDEVSYTITGKEGKQTLTTSTDMFYSIANKKNSVEEIAYTVTNDITSEGILSITQLKICDDPSVIFGELTEEDVAKALVDLGYEDSSVAAEPNLPKVPEGDEVAKVPESSDEPESNSKPATSQEDEDAKLEDVTGTTGATESIDSAKKEEASKPTTKKETLDAKEELEDTKEETSIKKEEFDESIEEIVDTEADESIEETEGEDAVTESTGFFGWIVGILNAIVNFFKNLFA